MNSYRTPALASTLILLLAAGSVRGQEIAATAQPDDTGNNQAGTALQAKVIEVKGAVEFAPVGADPLDAASWKPVTENMKLGTNTQIRTGLRSRCVLMFGESPDQTVISVRRATLASISDYRRSQTEQRVRIGLGYGAVRGGSSKGTLRSDVIVDSPVATLAKRGTQGFQIEVEPIGGYFRISLAESGLVEALSENRDRMVRPGEYATAENIARMWISQAIFDRAVRFYEVESVTPADLDFMVMETTGFASLAPDGGELASFFLEDASIVRPGVSPVGAAALLNAFGILLIESPPIHRPEGNFGLGSSLRVMAPRLDGSKSNTRTIADRPQRLGRSASRRPLAATRR